MDLFKENKNKREDKVEKKNIEKQNKLKPVW